MSHYDISYPNLAPDAKLAQAIQDIKDYIGDDRYNKLTDLIHQSYQLPLSIGEFRMALSMSGIQGYPVLAWHEVLWPGEDGDAARATGE